VSAQAKPISEVVKDFEQSLGNLRPSTKRVYVAGARAAIRAASLELWQSPSTTDLLASIGKSPTEKREDPQGKPTESAGSIAGPVKRRSRTWSSQVNSTCGFDLRTQKGILPIQRAPPPEDWGK
jgi:hypothetical protein